MRATTPLPALRAVATLLSLCGGLGAAACGSPGTAATPPVTLSGEYRATAPGTFDSIEFSAPSGYVATLGNCSDNCVEQGTYAFDASRQHIVLTDAAGKTTTYSFSAISNAPEATATASFETRIQANAVSLINSEANPPLINVNGQAMQQAFPSNVGFASTVVHTNVEANGIEVYFPGTSTCPTGQTDIEVEYDDFLKYFGGETSLPLWYELTNKSGSKTHASVTLTFNAEFQEYFWNECFPSDESTIALAFGSGDHWDSNINSSNYLVDLISSQPLVNPSVNFSAINGNPVSVVVDLQPAGNGNCAEPMLEVTYTDRSNYFGQQSQLLVWWQVNYKSGPSQSAGTNNLFALRPSSTGGNAYSAGSLACIPWTSDAVSLNLSFANENKSKWDPCCGTNYYEVPH